MPATRCLHDHADDVCTAALQPVFSGQEETGTLQWAAAAYPKLCNLLNCNLHFTKTSFHPIKTFGYLHLSKTVSLFSLTLGKCACYAEVLCWGWQSGKG